MNWKEAILSIIAICCIVVLPLAELIPGFAYSIPLLLMVWLVLKFSGKTFKDIGFSFKEFKLDALPIGALAALASFAFMQWAFFPVLEELVDWEYNDSGLNAAIRASSIQYILFLILAWLIGALYEEVVFHGFMFTQLESIIGGRFATPIAFMITASLFGIYHVQLGALGMVNAFIIGMVYLGLFILFKRNLWYSIISHGVHNSLVMTLIYFDLI